MLMHLIKGRGGQGWVIDLEWMGDRLYRWVRQVEEIGLVRGWVVLREAVEMVIH